MHELIVKEAAPIEIGDDDAESPHGTFNLILSTPTADREGEEVKAEEWEMPLPDHITFDIDHGMSVASTVGSGTPSINEDGQMVVTGSFASTQQAQDTRALVKEGHIRTASVAFLRKGGNAKSGGKTVTRELLNGAFVAVPANKEAVILDAKAATFALTGDRAAGEALRAAKKSLGLKVMAGSYEQRQQALSDALEARYPDPVGGWVYAYPLATFDDTVVYRLSGDTDLRGQWQSTYAVNDDGTVTLGDPVRVNLVETAVPVGSTSTASDTSDTPGTSTDDTTAASSASAADKAADAEHAARVKNMRALALRALAELPSNGKD